MTGNIRRMAADQFHRELSRCDNAVEARTAARLAGARYVGTPYEREWFDGVQDAYRTTVEPPKEQINLFQTNEVSNEQGNS